MSRLDHVVARRQGAERPRRIVQRFTTIKGGFRLLTNTLSRPHHPIVDKWWRIRMEQITTRRRSDAAKAATRKLAAERMANAAAAVKNGGPS